MFLRYSQPFWLRDIHKAAINRKRDWLLRISRGIEAKKKRKVFQACKKICPHRMTTFYFVRLRIIWVVNKAFCT